MKKFSLFLLALSFAAFSPAIVSAQLVRDLTPAPQNRSSQGQTPQPPRGKQRLSQEIQLTSGGSWVDTGIDVQAGEHLHFTASGKLRYADATDDTGPQGLPRSFKDLLRVLPDNGAGRGTLIGRIGDADTSQPFAIGAGKDVLSPISGRLSLGINETSSDSGDGTYSVRVEVYAPAEGAAMVVSKQVDSLPGIDNDLFTKIPRRIGDKQGNPGDMVNFLVIGSEEEMQNVFTTAGWVKVDADVRDAVLHGFIESLSKESYLTMPMSILYLFGRPQDYGWAHAEPISVVKTRNHLRIWKAPFQVSGRMLWVGAATHDIGFERDQRNNGVTHKIDPDIDLERDYVEKTLSSTGLVKEVTHFKPDNPLIEAKTATGGSFHSNGQVLVLLLGTTSAAQ